MLIAEMRKIEVRKRERERKAQDLQKLITASDRTPTTPANTSVLFLFLDGCESNGRFL